MHFDRVCNAIDFPMPKSTVKFTPLPSFSLLAVLQVVKKKGNKANVHVYNADSLCLNLSLWCDCFHNCCCSLYLAGLDNKYT